MRGLLVHTPALIQSTKGQIWPCALAQTRVLRGWLLRLYCTPISWNHSET